MLSIFSETSTPRQCRRSSSSSTSVLMIQCVCTLQRPQTILKVTSMVWLVLFFFFEVTKHNGSGTESHQEPYVEEEAVAQSHVWQERREGWGGLRWGGREGSDIRGLSRRWRTRVEATTALQQGSSTARNALHRVIGVHRHRCCYATDCIRHWVLTAADAAAAFERSRDK